jgi:hypothetical protein
MSVFMTNSALTTQIEAVSHPYYCYQAYGLQVQSSLAIPEFGSGVTFPRGAVDVVIDLAASVDWQSRLPVPVLERAIALQVKSDGIEIYVQAAGLFWVRGGTQITIFPALNGDLPRLRMALIGVAMAVLLHQRDCVVFHASAVLVNGEAVLFLGPSGAGKSSLAIALHHHGYPLLTDDLGALTLHAGIPHLAPAYPMARLGQDVALALALNWEAMQPLSSHYPKRAYPLPAPLPEQKPYPIARGYVLANSETLAIEPLAPPQILMALMQHSEIMALLATDRRHHFQVCAQLTQRFKVQQLQRPQSWNSLPALLARLDQEWRGEGT